MSPINSIKQLIDKGYDFYPLEGSGEKNKSLARLVVGRKNNQKLIVLKVFFNNTKAGRSYDNSLPLEKNIYKYLLAPLSTQQHTPNILKYFGSFSEPFIEFRNTLTKCRNELDKLQEQVTKKEERDRKHHNVRIRDISKLTILGLEYCKAPTLRRWLQTNRSNQELESVLFQIIYSAECLYRIGIRHNDLHVGNILISSSKQQTTHYRINTNQVIAVPTKKSLVKIYDFDNACGIRSKREDLHNKYIRSKYYNYKLKYYKYWDQYGMSDVDNPKYDTFTILSSIIEILTKYNTNLHLLNLIQGSLVKSKDLRNCPWKYVHRMGKKKDGTYFHASQNPSQPDYVPKDTELIDNNSILTHTVFSTWKTQSVNPSLSPLSKQISVYSLPNKHI